MTTVIQDQMAELAELRLPSIHERAVVLQNRGFGFS